MKARLILGAVLVVLLTSMALAADKEVSFRTDDGWTISANLSLPEGNRGKIPAVILLPSADHDPAAFGVYRYPGQYQYPGLSPVITRMGVAALSVDLRGQGKSAGSASLSGLNPEQEAQSFLDVRAAISFLASLPEIDSSRIAILAEGARAGLAVRGWDGDGRVRAMTFISGRLGDAEAKQLASAPDLPLLLVVSSEDKKSYIDMTNAYLASKNLSSTLDVYYGLGIGTAMFSVFRYKFPNEKPLQDYIGEWTANQVLMTGMLAEVSFKTDDGWLISANLRQPQGRTGKVPAVILFHSGLSDRHAYHDLEVALSKEGMAVLNLDWRGKGKSTNKGKYFEVTREERDKGYLDAKAAIAFLATQPDIDSDRIGVLGTVIGAKYAMAAVPDDPRIKTAVVLTGYIPTPKEKAYLTANHVPVLLATSKGHRAVTQALTELYELTKDKGSELLLFEGGAIGYQLFKLDHSLSSRVVRWMKTKLGV